MTDPRAAEDAARELFAAFLRGWNHRDARAIAALFAADGGRV